MFVLLELFAVGGSENFIVVLARESCFIQAELKICSRA